MHCFIPAVCLQVIVSYLQQFQNGLLKEGLNVTKMSVTGPEAMPNETPADQIAIQLGQPAFWIRYRSADALHPNSHFLCWCIPRM